MNKTRKKKVTFKSIDHHIDITKLHIVHHQIYKTSNCIPSIVEHDVNNVDTCGLYIISIY